MNLSNELFTTKDPATGELRGVSVDLMTELASRLGVPLELVVHKTAGNVADSVNAGTWDVAILAIEDTRAKTVAFSPALTEIEATYAVPKDSPLRSISQVDAPGIRISVPERAGYDLYLTSALRNATLIRTKTTPESIELVAARRVDAVAGLKPMLITAMPRLPDARLIDGKFMTVNHGFSTSVTRSQAAKDYLKTLAEDLKASGFVARSIERHHVQGLTAVK